MAAAHAHPYQNLPKTGFWSGGVSSPYNAQRQLSLKPLVDSLDPCEPIVSAGSCFAQYIGAELTSRNFHHLRSKHSAERAESFGLGNVYSLAQLRQWLEFVGEKRIWSETSVFEDAGGFADYLLPQGDVLPSREMVHERRRLVAEEVRDHLHQAKLFVFTIGLTETWRNTQGDVLPACPGTLIGRFDEIEHVFHNSTFNELTADLKAVELLLASVNPTLRTVYTVSPVPLTATASDDHVLLASTQSKAVIRAALGEFCRTSSRATYFPSFELMSHQIDSDWRYEQNLRNVSREGVEYVMSHAFEDALKLPERRRNAQRPAGDVGNGRPVCEEELLNAYATTCNPGRSQKADILLVGDSHLSRLAKGLELIGVSSFGGQVMNGSGFSDGRFELSDEMIFIPTENPESLEVWSAIHGRLLEQDGRCDIITNIGCQTHRTISHISNYLDSPVLVEANIAEYFEKNFRSQIQILSELARLGTVWMIEDPNFNAFIQNDATSNVRGHNFHAYCACLRKIAQKIGIGYLSPCDEALHRHYKESRSLVGIAESDGFHGTQLYYDYCANIVSKAIGAPGQHPAGPVEDQTFARHRAVAPLHPDVRDGTQRPAGSLRR